MWVDEKGKIVVLDIRNFIMDTIESDFAQKLQRNFQAVYIRGPEYLVIYGRNAFVLNIATHEMQIDSKLSGRFIDSLVTIKDWHYFKSRERVFRLNMITGETEAVTRKADHIPRDVRLNAKLFESHQRYLYIFGDIWDKQFLSFYRFDTEDNMSLLKCFIHLKGFHKCHWNYFFITQD